MPTSTLSLRLFSLLFTSSPFYLSNVYSFSLFPSSSLSTNLFVVSFCSFSFYFRPFNLYILVFNSIFVVLFHYFFLLSFSSTFYSNSRKFLFLPRFLIWLIIPSNIPISFLFLSISNITFYVRHPIPNCGVKNKIKNPSKSNLEQATLFSHFLRHFDNTLPLSVTISSSPSNLFLSSPPPH